MVALADLEHVFVNIFCFHVFASKICDTFFYSNLTMSTRSIMAAWLVCLLMVVLTVPGHCVANETVATNTPAPKSKITTTAQTTTLSPEQECARLNSSCSDCVGNSKCLYCYTGSKCMVYPSGKILPPSSMCDLDKARWGTCVVNFKALLISMGVIGGVILLTVTFFCIYCCCCRGKNTKKYEREDAKYESQRMERKAKQEERRNERRSRLDEIRMKYGLSKNDDYQRTY
ncbi:hypothetical protein RRG08_004539 [Elysia crispata]|uniref:PTTG1IP n=1 Tax=Elysia crispata TaxID=231223 RepID=A0AAE1BBB9_9GAST|nr:hypothetical protein RRG08_004539 [Elysia crispata]